MARYTLLVQPEPEAGGFSVTVPWLPGCFTQGETFEEAVEHAKDAIRTWIANAAASGEEIPVEDAQPLLVPVDVDVDDVLRRSRAPVPVSP
jgi:predicted RNase H-like HicB family nuclease